MCLRFDWWTLHMAYVFILDRSHMDVRLPEDLRLGVKMKGTGRRLPRPGRLTLHLVLDDELVKITMVTRLGRVRAGVDVWRSGNQQFCTVLYDLLCVNRARWGGLTGLGENKKPLYQKIKIKIYDNYLEMTSSMKDFQLCKYLSHDFKHEELTLEATLRVSIISIIYSINTIN